MSTATDPSDPPAAIVDVTLAPQRQGMPGELGIPTNSPQDTLLPESHRILERRFMASRPFGKDLNGETIRDMSGVSIRSNVEYLEEHIARVHGPEAGQQVLQDLIRLLNDRIPDPAYHVTAAFLKNPWMSYSNEFTAYLVDFCIDLSGDPDFQFKMGREKLIPPLIQTLMRPFSVGQIYRMAAYYAQHYCKDSYYLEGFDVTEGSAVLRMTLTEHALRQFGPYRRACARIWCNALQAGISIVPEKVHALGPASMTTRTCIVKGNDYCEWDVRWTAPQRWYAMNRVLTPLARGILQKEIDAREQVIQEQMRSLESRHEELERAYVDLQQTAIELQRRVGHLTTLQEAGLTFTTTRDREALLQHVLVILTQKLQYDRVLISFYDPVRHVIHDARLFGVSPEVAVFARQIEVPITDPASLEATVVLQGQPILVEDTSQILPKLHPLNRELVFRTGSQSFVSVPLKLKDRILGVLTVDRTQQPAMTADDLALMITFGNQLAIALDNADAYQEIEALNSHLEEKVRERTAQLEAANLQLKEFDELKNQFLSHLSHDLRTPIAAIQGYAINLLDGVVGPLSPKQTSYLERVKANTQRLARMISDLLDLSRMLFGKLQLRLETVALAPLAREVLAQFQLLTDSKTLTLELVCPDESLSATVDADRLVQMLTNLIDNAVKFTPRGGTVRLTMEQGTDHVVLEVSDTGKGIPESAITRLFDPFFQAHTGAGIKREGLGLGLAIVKYLVDLHGGTVSVTSREDVGTTFTIVLPQDRDKTVCTHSIDS